MIIVKKEKVQFLVIEIIVIALMGKIHKEKNGLENVVIINCIIINNKFNCLIFLINKLMNSSDISKKTNDNSNIKVMSDS